ncbi:hypothetical protein F7734_31450 [Scytonema sp. UIC 10036]|uniref:hypothetical protein n=1 Tax=Scytonema sp. UIC 10036 TaxID=2304196 RepID=UPI0012DADFED|nr:hypothetical protein [Scytonema sp. UIC 10036]MUG96610.1 hypothetical protein [Scytonema sp. UIC 10036]
MLLAVNTVAIGENTSLDYGHNLLYKSNKKEIDVTRISIGGIKLGMEEKDIIKKLGKPKSRTKVYDDVCYSAYITTWKYDGLEIRALNYSGLGVRGIPASIANKNQVYHITASSSQYPTEKGVKVGDRTSKAEKAYSPFSSKNEGDILVYPNDAFGGLSFLSNKQRVIRKIDILMASC